MLIRAARLRGRAAERVDLRAAVLVGDAAGTVRERAVSGLGPTAGVQRLRTLEAAFFYAERLLACGRPSRSPCCCARRGRRRHRARARGERARANGRRPAAANTRGGRFFIQRDCWRVAGVDRHSNDYEREII